MKETFVIFADEQYIGLASKLPLVEKVLRNEFRHKIVSFDGLSQTEEDENCYTAELKTTTNLDGFNYIQIKVCKETYE